MTRKRPAYPTDNSNLIALRLGAELEAAIRADAESLGVDVSTWLREAARSRLDAKMTEGERVLREVQWFAGRMGMTLEELEEALRKRRRG